MKLLLVDDRVVAADKPAGVPSQPDSSRDPAVAALAKRQLVAAGGGEIPFLAPTHRLDRPTSGIVLLARDDAAAADLSQQFRKQRNRKIYFAVVECDGNPAADEALEHHLAPQPNGNVRVYRKRQPFTKSARLRYRLLARAENPRRALLQVALETGVKHQIRAQLAFIGLPVVGDHRYGPVGGPAKPNPVLGGKANLLHAAQLVFRHPGSGAETTVVSLPPPHWQDYLAELSVATPNLAEALAEPWP